MNVIWMNHRPHYDSTFLSSVFSDCNHFEGLPTNQIDGAIILLVSGTSDDVIQIKEYVSHLKWAVIASIGSSYSNIPVAELQSSNVKVWVTEPHPDLHNNVRRLPAAFMWYTIARSYPIMQYDVERKVDWAFCGQLASPGVRDSELGYEWSSAIRALPNGDLRDSVGGIKEDYERFLASAKVVPCRPSCHGPETARVYEALEAGCIPITSYRPTHKVINVSEDAWKKYWPWVLGERPPFPIIDSPDQLADAMKETLFDWDNQSKIVQSWWADYKNRLGQTLRAEVYELQKTTK